MKHSAVIDKIKSNKFELFVARPSKYLSWMEYPMGVEVDSWRSADWEAYIERALIFQHRDYVFKSSTVAVRFDGI